MPAPAGAGEVGVKLATDRFARRWARCCCASTLLPLLSRLLVLDTVVFHRHRARVGCTEKPFRWQRDLDEPPLKVPEGLERPDTRNAIKIPPLEYTRDACGKSEPCLDQPPSFATGSPAGPSAGRCVRRTGRSLPPRPRRLQLPLQLPTATPAHSACGAGDAATPAAIA